MSTSNLFLALQVAQVLAQLRVVRHWKPPELLIANISQHILQIHPVVVTDVLQHTNLKTPAQSIYTNTQG